MRYGAIASGWSAVASAGIGFVAVFVGQSHAPAWDWVQYLGVILVLIGALIGLWSMFRSRRVLVIVLGIVACIPLAFFASLMYRLAGVAS
jgi:protein-S-isoprenylcysteine O-methyltransferase Ste14